MLPKPDFFNINIVFYAAGSGASPLPPPAPLSSPFPSSGVGELLVLELSNFWILIDFIMPLNMLPGVKIILRFFNVSVVTSFSSS